MEFIEINAAIKSGLQGFQEFIQQQIRKNKDFLKQIFWIADGYQMTVLNYLIHIHQERNQNHELGDPSLDLTDYIEYVFSQAQDKNFGEPIHQALSSQKVNLVFRLLGIVENSSFNWDQRDIEGRTLLSLIVGTKNEELLTIFLEQNPNVNATTLMGSSRVHFQPLHQAVVLNFAAGVSLLAKHGAQLSNAVGNKKETPLLLAARLGRINALEALLQIPAQYLSLNETNINSIGNKSGSNTAVEELCFRIQRGIKPIEALKGIAMLLCCGAEPPPSVELRQLLSDHRETLLKVIHNFLEDKPELVEGFVNRCHLKESSLHNIVYANHSWGSSIRHLFGKPSDAAFIVEDLVSRKYRNQSSDKGLSSGLAVNKKPADSTETLKRYAEFVRRYTAAYDSQRITNRWSSMRWMIAEGNCDWETVLRYSENNPSSRTRIIIDEMFAPVSVVHENVDGVESMTPAL